MWIISIILAVVTMTLAARYAKRRYNGPYIRSEILPNDPKEAANAILVVGLLGSLLVAVAWFLVVPLAAVAAGCWYAYRGLIKWFES